MKAEHGGQISGKLDIIFHNQNLLSQIRMEFSGSSSGRGLDTLLSLG